MTGRRESEATATLYADQGEELADLRKRLDDAIEASSIAETGRLSAEERVELYYRRSEGYARALREIRDWGNNAGESMKRIARAALSGAPAGEG